MYGGAITAILLNIPGDPANAPTCWDGYPMAQKGEASLAIGIALVYSGIGGFASAVIMTFTAPVLAEFALKFSPVEKFAVVLLGMACVTSLGAASRVRATSALLLGMAAGTIGLAPIYSSLRFTGGTELLQGGIEFVVALIGMFAIAEVIDGVARRVSGWPDLPRHVSTRMPGWAEYKRLFGTAVRSTAIGTAVGAVPGGGGVVAAFLAYGVEKQVSPHGKDFGTGVLEGVAAPEAANNASTGGAMIPTLALGIPGSAATAVMLAVMTLHGFEPGPLLFMKAPEFVHTIFAAMLVVNLLMIFAGLLTTPLFVQLLRIPEPVLNACILILCILGVYGIRNLMADVWIMLGFGVLGFIMRRSNFSVPAFIIGLLLGPMAETYFLTVMRSYDDSLLPFVTRPISAVLIASTVLIIFAPEVGAIWRRLRPGKVSAT
jgi:putative tricarboxylic transport membrane protein